MLNLLPENRIEGNEHRGPWLVNGESVSITCEFSEAGEKKANWAYHIHFRESREKSMNCERSAIVVDPGRQARNRAMFRKDAGGVAEESWPAGSNIHQYNHDVPSH